jgi:hypothetical protein
MKKSIELDACRKRQATMSRQYTRAIVHMLFAGLIAGAALAPSNALADAEPKVLGKTIGEWSAKWWQWALAIPASTNPMIHGDCEQGQQGPVWFITGEWNSKGEHISRSCNVPRAKHILFSILNNSWIQTPDDDEAEPDCKGNETCWREHAMVGPPPLDGAQLEATLDKKSIIFNPNTPIIRSQSPVFTASFPPDYVFGIDDLSKLTGRPIVSDGFWVMLPPLSPGTHTLYFKASSQGATRQEITYHLTVGNP